MKKQMLRVMTIVGFVACSLFSVSTYAQSGKHTPEEKAKKMTDSLKANLSLDDSQYSKVYALNVNYFTKMQDLRQQAGSREEKKQSFKELRKSQNKDLTGILTADQLEKYKAWKKDMKEDRKDHRKSKDDSGS